ncbi:DUF3592 domain-containing protein [Entomomonas sp. E2T0]|uniref:DUF3592 domain-containing protein n=1 Tax=Entomomonas sp. E2T0 TaxID=2930213 RepID=UPI002228386B|nr:DUF3592 domain-containing protein [Entomomonas sp. E2T0]UYZ83367.1 DUF3592 domain-containing protein [Entomomonas sp. E2T0]
MYRGKLVLERLITALTGIAVLLIGFYLYNKQDNMYKNGIPAIGIVTEKDTNILSTRNKGSRLTISFTDKQDSNYDFQTSRDTAYNSFKKGDTVRVLYKEDNPNYVVLDNGTISMKEIVGCTVIGIALIIFSIFGDISSLFKKR